MRVVRSQGKEKRKSQECSHGLFLCTVHQGVKVFSQFTRLGGPERHVFLSSVLPHLRNLCEKKEMSRSVHLQDRETLSCNHQVLLSGGWDRAPALYFFGGFFGFWDEYPSLGTRAESEQTVILERTVSNQRYFKVDEDHNIPEGRWWQRP